MTKPVEFPKYEGQKNYPTWVTMLVVDNEQTAFNYYRSLAKEGLEDIKNDIIAGMQNIIRGHESSPHDQILASWLSYSVGKVDWYIVHETLAGREVSREPDTLTEIAIEAIKHTNWQDVIQGFEYRFEADDALKSWFQDKVDLWTSMTSVRRGQGSQLVHFCRNAYEICLAVVDWQAVYEDFSEEL